MWRRWGNVIVVVSVAVIALVAGYKGWQYWQLKQSEQAAHAYFAAITLADQGKSDEALKKFADIAAGGHRGYASLARMNLAAELAAAGKRDEAVKIYDEIAASAAARPLASAPAAIQLTSRAPSPNFCSRARV